MVLLDGAVVDRGSDFAGAPLIQAVFERISAEGSGDLDAAVVLTKSDLCTSMPMTAGDNLRKVVETRDPDLARFLGEQGIQIQWVPVSVCGPDATDDSGLPIYASLAPQGYETIFDQLFRRSNRPRNRLFKRIAAALVLMLFLVSAWTILRAQQVRTQSDKIRDPAYPLQQLSGDIKLPNETLFRERYEKKFAKAKKDIDECGNVKSIDRVLREFDQIPPAQAPLVAIGLAQLESHASVRKEQVLHKAVVDCQQLRTGDCAALIGKYLSEFPNGPNANDLRKMLDDINLARYLTARGQVKAIPVTSTAALRQKIVAITKFLKDYDQLLKPAEKTAISVARDTATDLLVSRDYHCTLIRTSGMDTARDHGVQIYVNRKRIANYNDSGDVSEKNWNRSFTINWQSGHNIQVKLVNYDGRDQEMAYFDNNTPIAIVLLARESDPSRYATTTKYFGTDFTKSRPPFKIKFNCRELPPAKLKVITDYLLPGDKW